MYWYTLRADMLPTWSPQDVTVYKMFPKTLTLLLCEGPGSLRLSLRGTWPLTPCVVSDTCSLSFMDKAHLGLLQSNAESEQRWVLQPPDGAGSYRHLPDMSTCPGRAGTGHLGL